MTAPNRVLVTGATGFLGSHLVRRLVDDGADVHILTRREAPAERLGDVWERVTPWIGDVLDSASLNRCLVGAHAELIFHFAGDTNGRRFTLPRSGQLADWSVAEHSLQVNFGGTVALLRGVASCGTTPRALLRLGGLEEYGTGPVPYVESQREEPSSPYSAAQVAATHWCRMLQPHLQFDVVTLRPALIYGPAQSTDFLIPALIRDLLRGQRFSLSDGSQHRDLLFVDDFIEAVARAADTSGLGGKIINISSGQEYRIRDVALMIAQALEAEDLLDFGALPSRESELEHLVARNDVARELLRWEPKIQLEEGLIRTITSYRA